MLQLMPRSARSDLPAPAADGSPSSVKRLRHTLHLQRGRLR